MEKFLTTILLMFVFVNIFLKYFTFLKPPAQMKVFFEKNFPFVLDILILLIGTMVFFSILGVDLNLKGKRTLEKVVRIEGKTLF